MRWCGLLEGKGRMAGNQRGLGTEMPAVRLA